MPGNVGPALPSSVFPQTLSISFVEDSTYLYLLSAMHDGTILRGQLVTHSRKTFRQSKRLSFTDLIIFKSLWDSNGSVIPVLFYNPFEPAPGQPIGSNYDPGGSSVQGRYTVLMRMPGWNQTSGLARVEVEGIVLVEAA